MKKIKYLILSLSAACCMSACLDEEPLYTQNNDIVFSSSNNAELALLGCYSYMTDGRGYGQMWQELPISASGFSWTQRNGNTLDLAVSLNATSSDRDIIGAAWNGMYKVISEVNAYLENLGKSNLPEDIKIQYGGEAKFLRAVAYYNLVSHFGDVPFKTTASTSEGITIGRTPAAEILGHIIDDLKDAEKISTKSDVGRVNSWAAKAFMGKVYYRMAVTGVDPQSNWINAKTKFDEVYDNKVYELEKNFSSLFGEWVTDSKEDIFQLNFTSIQGQCFNRASNRFSPEHSTTGVNWTTYQATKASYDMHQSMYPGDPRIPATFLTITRATKNNQPNPNPQVGDKPSANDSVYHYPYFTYKVKTGVDIDNKPIYEKIQKEGKDVADKIYVGILPYDKFNNPANPSLSYLEGLQVPTDASPRERAEIEALKNLKVTFAENANHNKWPAHAKLYDPKQSGQLSHKNLMVYRYAEMLLLMADVYNELDNKNRAIELANEVLKRARESVTPAALEPADWPKTLTKEQVTEKLYFERIIELFGEPCMYEMVRIRGTEYMKKALEYHNNHEFTKASDAYYDKQVQSWSDRIYNNGNLTEEFLKKNLLLPIPDTERDNNPGITDNNFGY